MVPGIKSFVYLLAVCLIGNTVRLAEASHTIEGVLPALNISQFGSAWKDPCSESWSNDVKPDYPCPTTSPTPSPTALPTVSPTPAPTSAPTNSPTAAPTATPTIDWAAATTIFKNDMCHDAPVLPEDVAEDHVLTMVTFYYTVETTPDGNLHEFLPPLENALLQDVAGDAFLPCEGESRKLANEKKANLRRNKDRDLQGSDVSITSISSNPADTELTQFSCTPKEAGNKCFVIQGDMTVLHNNGDDPADVETAVLQSVQEKMGDDSLTSIDTVEDVIYLGTSFDEVKASLGPEETILQYYYTVETKPGANPDDFTAAIEDGLLDSVTREVVDASVGGISSEPVDMELTEYACVAEMDGNDCYVYKGEMTVLHDGSSSEEVVKDDVLASVEGSMTSGELAGSIEDVEKVAYLGDSLEDVEASLGPEETILQYYYTVETKPGANPDDFTAAIEDGLLDSVTREVVDASVGGISSEPVDMELTEYACVAEMDGNDCYVYKGEMTVLHDGSSSEEVVKDDVLASVEGSMTSGELAGSIEDVEKVAYLGDSLEDVTAALGPPFDGTPVVEQIQESIVGPGDEDDDDEDSQMGVIIGASLAAAFIALLALLLHRRRTRQLEEGKERDLDEMNSFEGEGELDENALYQNYDAEPGSFHLGQFHYTKDGRRYLSPSCELCRANSAFNMNRDSNFIRANSKDLGSKHSSLDVHECTSATCIRCQNGTPGQVEFIKASDATFCQPIVEESLEGNDGDETLQEEEETRSSGFGFWKK